MASVTNISISPKMVAIVRASRPPGWCFGPILYVIGLIHAPSVPRDLIAVLTALAQVLSLSFPLCIIIFGMNDVYDYDSDLRNPRKLASGLEGGVLAPAYHSSVRMAARFSTALIFLVSLATSRSHNMLASALLVALGWQYSAPPLRFKEIPVLDSFSNGMIVFLSWFVGYSFGRGSFSNAPNKGYILALCTAGVHVLGAVMDLESDVAADQQTIATFLGPHSAAVLGAFAFVIPLFTERWNSIFGIYLWGASIAMLFPCFRVQWAHQAFKFIVYWSVAMSIVWFISKVIRHFIMRNLWLH